MNTLPDKGLYTSTEAARLLGVSPTTLRRWEAEDRLTPLRTLGGDRRYSPKDIQKVLTSFRKETDQRREPELTPITQTSASNGNGGPPLIPIKKIEDYQPSRRVSSVRQLAVLAVALIVGGYFLVDSISPLTYERLKRAFTPSPVNPIVDVNDIAEYRTKPSGEFRLGLKFPVEAGTIFAKSLNVVENAIFNTSRFLGTVFFGNSEKYFIQPTGDASFRNLDASIVRAGDVTVSGKSIKEIAEAGGDADTLESQSGSYYLSWGNTTSKPTILSSLDGVSNNEGDIDLIAGSNITIIPDDGANTVTITATGGGDIEGVTAGSGLSGGGTTGTVTLSHSDTSSQTSVDNSNGVVIQDITLDAFGHLTVLGTVNLDTRYYTETETDTLLAAQDALSEMGDVTIALAESGDYLRFSGAAWVDVGISQVLTDLLTVDGSTSGLDADLLDGQTGTYYLDLDNETGTCTDCLTTTEIDESTFAGLGSTNINDIYLFNDGDTIAGNLTFEKTGTADAGTQYPSYDTILQGSSWNTTTASPVDLTGRLRLITGSGPTGSIPYRIGIFDNTPTEFVSFDLLNQAVGIGTTNPDAGLEIDTSGSVSGFKIENGDSSDTWFNYQNESTNYIRGTTTYVDTTLDMNNNGIVDINWGASDDGSGSGLDADLLDGWNLATASTASTVVGRDGSGDINARLFRSEYDTTNATIGYIMTQIDTASNNYIRPSTPAQLVTGLGLEAGGSRDIWVEKDGDTMTGTLTSSVGTGSNRFAWTGGAMIRMTDQGGFSLYSDSSVLFHAGDNGVTLISDLGITNATTAEILYITADNDVKIITNRQTDYASSKTFTFAASGNLTIPGDLTVSGGNLYIGNDAEWRDNGTNIIYTPDSLDVDGYTYLDGLRMDTTLNMNDQYLDSVRAIRGKDWDDDTGGADDKYRLLYRDGAHMFYNGGVAIGPYGNGTWADLADGTLIVNGNVGIGAVSPGERLTVGNGTTSIQRIDIDSGTQSHLQLSQGGTARWSLNNNDAASGSFGIYDFDGTGGVGYRFVIDNSGDVGIGTLSPDTKLDIEHNSGPGSPHIRLFETGAADGARIDFKTTGNSNYWTTYGMTSSTHASSSLNFYYNGFGNILELKGDGATIAKEELWWYGFENELFAFKTTIEASNYIEAFSGADSSMVGIDYFISQRDAKRDFQPMSEVVDSTKIYDLETLSFYYKSDPDDARKSIGLVAEDVDEILPEIVAYNSDNKPHHINYGLLSVLNLDQLQQIKPQLAKLNMDLSLTTSGDLVIEKTATGSYQVRNTSNGSVAERISAFAELVVANVKAGSAVISTLRVEELSIGEQNLEDYVKEIITSVGTADGGGTTRTTAEGVFEKITATILGTFEKLVAKTAEIASAFIKKLTVESLAVQGGSVGQVIIPKGETELSVDYTDLTETSKVFFTLDRAVAAGVEKTPGEGFKFILADPSDLPVTIDYWIVE